MPLFQSNGVFDGIARIEMLNPRESCSAATLGRPSRHRQAAPGWASGSFGVEYGNRDSAGGGHFGGVVSGTLNRPVSEISALRINLLGSRQDAIARAVIISSDGPHIDQEQTRLAARVKFLWEPDGETNLYVSADYSRERRAGGIWGRMLRTLGSGACAAALQRAGAIPGPKNLRYGIDAPASYRSGDTYGGSVSFEHELTPAVPCRTSWPGGNTTLACGSTPITRRTTIQPQHTRDATYRQFSGELRLAFDLDGIEGQVGLCYPSRNKGDSSAAFGPVNFHVTDAFALLAGAHSVFLTATKACRAGRLRPRSS